jgi:CrcB protein
MTVVTWVGVALLGGAGAVARFVVDGAVAGRVDRDLPVGTLAVNVSGAFVLGLVAGLALTGDALLLVGAATLGSYTTFSTWMLETQRLVEEGQSHAAAVNIVLSLAAGIAAVALGRAIG